MNNKNTPEYIDNLKNICFQDVKKRWGENPKRKIMSFFQQWGNGSCGFGGLSRSVISDALTIIIEDSTLKKSAIYFGGRHAYDVNHNDEKYKNFLFDLKIHRIQSVKNAQENYPLVAGSFTVRTSLI